LTIAVIVLIHVTAVFLSARIHEVVVVVTISASGQRIGIGITNAILVAVIITVWAGIGIGTYCAAGSLPIAGRTTGVVIASRTLIAPDGLLLNRVAAGE
jgi:hypothetical protein